MAKYCSEDGCRTIIDQGRYCENHQKRKPKGKVYYSKNKSFYNSKPWIELAEYVRFRDGYRCTVCGKPVFGRDSQVDHKIPIWLNPELRLDEDNTRLVCSRCHPRVEYQPKDAAERLQRLHFDPSKYF